MFRALFFVMALISISTGVSAKFTIPNDCFTDDQIVSLLNKSNDYVKCTDPIQGEIYLTKNDVVEVLPQFPPYPDLTTEHEFTGTMQTDHVMLAPSWSDVSPGGSGAGYVSNTSPKWFMWVGDNRGWTGYIFGERYITSSRSHSFLLDTARSMFNQCFFNVVQAFQCDKVDFNAKLKAALKYDRDYKPPPTSTPTNPTDPTTPTAPTNPTDNTTNCGIIDIPCNLRRLFIPSENYLRDQFNSLTPERLGINTNIPVTVLDRWCWTIPMGSVLNDINACIVFPPEMSEQGKDQLRFIIFWGTFLYILHVLGIPFLGPKQSQGDLANLHTSTLDQKMNEMDAKEQARVDKINADWAEYKRKRASGEWDF